MTPHASRRFPAMKGTDPMDDQARYPNVNPFVRDAIDLAARVN
jgi:hypothetical protein